MYVIKWTLLFVALLLIVCVFCVFVALKQSPTCKYASYLYPYTDHALCLSALPPQQRIIFEHWGFGVKITL